MTKKTKAVPARRFPKKREHKPEETKKEPKAVTFRPIGPRVLVLFPQSDWEVGTGGLLVKSGLTGVGFRMDGMVVAVGTRGIPEGVCVGSTVYADPRVGDPLNLDGTRYHIMRCDDLMAVAEQGGKNDD